MKMTRWFGTKTKPVRVGVYMTRYYSSHPGYSYWNGERWGWEFPTIKQADKDRKDFGASQHKPWRGLANPPKQSKGEK